MNEAEKERLIKKDIKSIENRVRSAFNQGYEMGLKESRSKILNTYGDVISRQAVLDAFWKLDVKLSPTAIWTIQNMVKDLPSVTSQQKVGRWIVTDDDLVYCSECEDSYYPRPIDASWYYCPHCGARMEDVKENG